MSVTHVADDDPEAAALVRKLAEAAEPLSRLRPDCAAPLLEALLRNVRARPDLPERPRHVAFCSTCLGRGWQARLTLPYTLLTLLPLAGRAILFLADFDQGAPLSTWIAATLAVPGIERVLQVFHTARLRGWHASKAKNAISYAAIRHLVNAGAPPDQIVIFNLDCDRVMGPDLPVSVFQQFSRTPSGVVQWASNEVDGSYGMLASSAATFEQVHGYDEDFAPSGCQDTDIMMRMRAFQGRATTHIRHRHLVGFGLDNDTEHPSEHTSRAGLCAKVAQVSPEWQGVKWGRMDSDNRAAMHKNMEARRYVANLADDWRPVALGRRALEGPGGGQTPLEGPSGGQTPLEPKPPTRATAAAASSRQPSSLPVPPPDPQSRLRHVDKPVTVKLIACGVRRLWSKWGHLHSARNLRACTATDLQRLHPEDVRAVFTQAGHPVDLLLNCAVFTESLICACRARARACVCVVHVRVCVICMLACVRAPARACLNACMRTCVLHARPRRARAREPARAC